MRAKDGEISQKSEAKAESTTDTNKEIGPACKYTYAAKKLILYIDENEFTFPQNTLKKAHR